MIKNNYSKIVKQMQNSTGTMSSAQSKNNAEEAQQLKAQTLSVWGRKGL